MKVGIIGSTGLTAVLLLGGCYDGSAGGAETDGGGEGTDGEGTDGEETDGTSADSGDTFGCAPDMWPESLSMRRLSEVQYRNTVQALLTWAAGPEVFVAVEPTLARMPIDVRQPVHGAARGGFRRLDQNVHQEHIDGSYDVAVAAARELTQAHLAAVAGDCAIDGDTGNDEACIDAFIDRFGARALRRPLTDEERTFYREVYDAQGVTEGTEPEAFGDVITVMMTSPSFLYLVEHGDEELEDIGGVYRLGGYELAQRLSYQFWQAPPDDALLAAAADASLLDDEVYEAQVDRLLDDPRSVAAVETFFGEWLWVEDLPAVDARLGTPVYDSFLDRFEVGPETTQNMVDEVLTSASYYALDTDGTFEDFFLSDRSFATTPDLAAIYGVPMWEGGEPPAFPQAERAGVLTRAAFVASGSSNTRPIMKGVRIREAVLCDELAPPPDNAAGNPPDLSPENTTREVVEMLTEQEGTACAGCHATQINPLGFVTEHFDALGRYRTEQILFDDDGNVTGARPVDSTTTPRIDFTDDRQVSSMPELSEILLESERVQACFARNYVRWTFGREEDAAQDGCMLDDTTTALLEGAPLRDVLRDLALRDEFKTRKIEE